MGNAKEDLFSCCACLFGSGFFMTISVFTNKWNNHRSVILKQKVTLIFQERSPRVAELFLSSIAYHKTL